MTATATAVEQVLVVIDAIGLQQDRIARSHGFRLLRHRHILYGTCTKENCPRRRR